MRTSMPSRSQYMYAVSSSSSSTSGRETRHKSLATSSSSSASFFSPLSLNISSESSSTVSGSTPRQSSPLQAFEVYKCDNSPVPQLSKTTISSVEYDTDSTILSEELSRSPGRVFAQEKNEPFPSQTYNGASAEDTSSVPQRYIMVSSEENRPSFEASLHNPVEITYGSKSEDLQQLIQADSEDLFLSLIDCEFNDLVNHENKIKQQHLDCENNPLEIKRGDISGREIIVGYPSDTEATNQVFSISSCSNSGHGLYKSPSIIKNAEDALKVRDEVFIALVQRCNGLEEKLRTKCNNIIAVEEDARDKISVIKDLKLRNKALTQEVERLSKRVNITEAEIELASNVPDEVGVGFMALKVQNILMKRAIQKTLTLKRELKVCPSDEIEADYSLNKIKDEDEDIQNFLASLRNASTNEMINPVEESQPNAIENENFEEEIAKKDEKIALLQLEVEQMRKSLPQNNSFRKVKMQANNDKKQEKRKKKVFALFSKPS